MPMQELSLTHADIDDSDDLDRVRALLLDALVLLDRSAMPAAVTAATFVSHALELLSPGADTFELIEPDTPNL
jgi:hypothetical protein